jgi:hypothetical protein
VQAALTPPFIAAALVLCAAGIAKLRSPAPAVAALQAVGVSPRLLRSAGRALVRCAALAELALGGWCAIAPSRPAAALLAAAYALFAGIAVLLVRRRAACGCFGDERAPASLTQSMLSAAFAVIAALAATEPVHGAAWILDRPPGSAVAVSVGIAGIAYAAVIAYTELPQAWTAWSAR